MYRRLASLAQSDEFRCNKIAEKHSTILCGQEKRDEIGAVLQNEHSLFLRETNQNNFQIKTSHTKCQQFVLSNFGVAAFYIWNLF